MGYSPGSPPSAIGIWSVSGSYKILDSIAFTNAQQDGNLDFEGSNNMIRDLSFVNTYSV